MSQRPSLSVAVITLNEEERIRDCLESVKDMADEIIVVDSLSTDRTEEICRSYSKLKFFRQPFQGYGRQKNIAFQHCACDWILNLDADERVSPELADSIQTFLSGNPEPVGMEITRLTWHMGKFIRHGGWYPNATCRLFARGRARSNDGDVHESIVPEKKGKRLKGDLLHYSVKDLADQVKTINTYSSIAALSRYNKGRSFHLWRLLLKPVSKFIELYLFKLGFLDGMQGFIIAVSSSYSAFLKEAKLFELSRLNSDKPSNLTGLYRKER